MAPTTCSNRKTNGRRTQGPNHRSPHDKAITSASSSNTADPPSKHISNTSRPRRSAAAIQTPRNSSSPVPDSDKDLQYLTGPVNKKRLIKTDKQKDMLNKAWDISPNPPIVAIIYLAHITRLHDQPMGFHKIDDFFRGRRVNKTKHATKTGNNLEIERLHQGGKRVKKVTDKVIKAYKGDREGFIYKYEAGIIDENTGEELCEPCLKQDTWIRKYKAANRALLGSVASKEFQDPGLGFEKVNVNSDHPGPVDSKPAQEKNMGVKERAANTGPLDTAARNSVSKQVLTWEEEDEVISQERKDFATLFTPDMNSDPFFFEDDLVHAQFSQAKAVSTEASAGPAQDKPAESALYWRGTFNTVHDQNEGWGKPCAEEKLEDYTNP